MLYILLAAAIFLNASANILIKAGMRHMGSLGGKSAVEVGAGMLTNPFLIFGVISFAVTLALYSLVLSKMNLSVAYPIMTSLGLLVVTTYCWLFFSERISFIQWAGYLLIIAGVWMVAAPRGCPDAGPSVCSPPAADAGRTAADVQ
jgi:multidrug transporter EmrE-like cation transporter